MYVDDQLPPPGRQDGESLPEDGRHAGHLVDDIGPEAFLVRLLSDVQATVEQLREHELRLRVPRLGDARRLRDGW